MKVKSLLKAIFFLFIFFIFFLTVQNVIVCDPESTDQARLDTAFMQKENSLDGVFLGPSTTYASWVAPIAFEEYGITVYSMSSAAQPLFATKYMIDDMRRKQPDAVYIINITHYLVSFDKYLPNFLESYPLTLNKLNMTAYLSDIADFSLKEKFEVFCPLFKYHERWSSISQKDFLPLKDKYKSASYYSPFLNKRKNIGAIQQDFTTYDELSDTDYNGLADLMYYCKKENVKVLFVIMPQGDGVEGRAGKQNTSVSVLQSQGFDVLDLRKHINEIGLDPHTDFYNSKHMNVSGASKVTRFISEYLAEKYGFTDKRGDSGFSDWEKAAVEYGELIKTAKVI